MTVHRRALDLADEMDAMADGVPAWGTTASKLRQAASSLRWQVRWETQHPSQAYYSHKAMEATTVAVGPEGTGS